MVKVVFKMGRAKREFNFKISGQIVAIEMMNDKNSDVTFRNVALIINSFINYHIRLIYYDYKIDRCTEYRLTPWRGIKNKSDVIIRCRDLKQLISSISPKFYSSKLGKMVKPQIPEQIEGKTDDETTKMENDERKMINIRMNWTKGEKVEIFSNSFKCWNVGTITQIFNDKEGEWLKVMWINKSNGEGMSKEIKRFCDEIRPYVQKHVQKMQTQKQKIIRKQQKPITQIPIPIPIKKKEENKKENKNEFLIKKKYEEMLEMLKKKEEELNEKLKKIEKSENEFKEKYEVSQRKLSDLDVLRKKEQTEINKLKEMNNELKMENSEKENKILTLSQKNLKLKQKYFKTKQEVEKKNDKIKTITKTQQEFQFVSFHGC